METTLTYIAVGIVCVLVSRWIAGILAAGVIEDAERAARINAMDREREAQEKRLAELKRWRESNL